MLRSSPLRPLSWGMIFLLALLVTIAGCRDRKPILVGFAGPLTGRYADLGIAGRDGVLIAITFLQTFDRASDSPAYQPFSRNYRDRFKRDPRFASVHRYDATKILIAALTRDREPKNLKQTIFSLGNFDGLQSKIMLDRFGDPKRTPFLMVVKNGTFQRVK